MTVKVNYDVCCFKDGACTSKGCSTSCGCGAEDKECGCVKSCPVDAISKTDKVVIDPDLCTDCGACIDACPINALSEE